jgi:hypothetical protein
MQIAGIVCKVCGQNIILSSEGKFCPGCRTAVHLTCESQDSCAVCGQAYEVDKGPEADPLRDAVLPPELRPNRSGGPAFAISVGVAFLLLAVIIWLIEYALSRGH